MEVAVMIRVVANNYFKEEDVEKIMPYLKALADGSRTDEGNISYNLYVNPKDKGNIVMIEEWESPDNLKPHGAKEHFTKNVAALNEYKQKDGTIQVLIPLDI